MRINSATVFVFSIDRLFPLDSITDFSPKSKSLQTYDFGDIQCQFT